MDTANMSTTSHQTAKSSINQEEKGLKKERENSTGLEQFVVKPHTLSCNSFTGNNTIGHVKNWEEFTVDNGYLKWKTNYRTLIRLPIKETSMSEPE